MSTAKYDQFALGQSMAETLHDLHTRAQQWEEANPQEADYRVSDLISNLSRAATAARLLADNDHSPQWWAAMATLRAQLDEQTIDHVEH